MPPEHRRDTDEVAIRDVRRAITEALRTRDDAGSHCSPDRATFDAGPSPRHTDAESIRRLWARTLASFDPPVEYDLEDITITATGDVAFNWCLSRIGGARVVKRLRSTFGFRKIDGRWRLVHEHVKVRGEAPSGPLPPLLRP
jgi:ketosteroid isomerase-like protein